MHKKEREEESEMSPKDFDACVAEGGRVRTMKMGKSKYAHVCYDKAGKSHMGEIKTKKAKKES